MGIHAGHRVRPLLVPTRLPRGGGVVSESGRSAGRTVVVAVAGGDHAGAGRRPAVVEDDVGADSTVGGGRLVAKKRGTPAGTAAGARRHRIASARCRRVCGPFWTSACR